MIYCDSNTDFTYYHNGNILEITDIITIEEIFGGNHYHFYTTQDYKYRKDRQHYYFLLLSSDKYYTIIDDEYVKQIIEIIGHLPDYMICENKLCFPKNILSNEEIVKLKLSGAIEYNVKTTY